MGRTNPTYRDVLRSLEDDWTDYRRALRQQDQHHFDPLYRPDIWRSPLFWKSWKARADA